MGKDDNFDLNPEFDENFHKVIDKVLSDTEINAKEIVKLNSDVESDGAAALEEVQENSENEEKENPGQEEITEGDNQGTEEAEEIEDVLTDINSSLALQISEELGNTQSTKDSGKKKKSKARKVLQGILIGVVSLAVVVSFLGFTKPGNELLIKMGVNLSGKIWATFTDGFEEDPVLADDIDKLEEEDLQSNDPEINPAEIIWPEHKEEGIPEGRQEEGVYNILLLGEEAIDSGTARGRTDVIIIATLNTNEKSIKLTSLMRDTLVQIPGYLDNKLNTAYEKGGINLLYQTIALNFDIKIDGCAMVSFENFEKIVDQLGGLEITLTASEAKYLNHTNYISKPQYRTVVEGTQLMNGNQVLGYTRIRKRAAVTGKNNDYGRTDRHRIVLDAIFEKYKTKSKIDLLTTMFGLLPMIDTDIKDTNFEFLLNAFIETGATKIEQLRIPADGTFTDTVKVRGLDALIPDMEENVAILHEFIFGNVKE